MFHDLIWCVVVFPVFTTYTWLGMAIPAPSHVVLACGFPNWTKGQHLFQNLLCFAILLSEAKEANT
jgi:hypothetical protein